MKHHKKLLILFILYNRSRFSPKDYVNNDFYKLAKSKNYENYTRLMESTKESERLANGKKNYENKSILMFYSLLLI